MNFYCDSPESVKVFAARLAPLLRAGDCLLLNGPLAVGKTHFVQTLATVMEVQDNVTSPTYTLVHLYQTVVLPLVHVDAYRLKSVEEYEDLALYDQQINAITLIEWGEKVQAAHPDALSLDFSFEANNKRRINGHAQSKRWVPVLDQIFSP